jgi:predicted DNA-binding transcriptional regulator YafY
MFELQLTDEKWTESIDFNPDQFFKHAIGITASAGKPEKVIFKADNVAAKYIDSQPFHSSQQIVKTGKNRTTFEMTVFISEELIRGLLSYGGEIQVIQPEILKDQIVNRVKAMVEQYS